MNPTGAAFRKQDLLPLRGGDSGEAVADLQERLRRLGFAHGEDRLGEYGSGTVLAVQEFQAQRGLRLDGICGRETWSSLVEAGFRLGDRLLYRRVPMLQGDDVAEVQRRLSGLGFDPGGVDGIFGDSTHTALCEFQHNVGVLTDGICGPRTLLELTRVEPVRGGADLVSPLREQLRVVGDLATLSCKHIAIGEEGGFATGVAAVHRVLTAAGSRCLQLHDPDPLAQAAAANLAKVDCYIGLRLEPSHESAATYFYRGFRYESAASRQLAELLVELTAVGLGLGNAGAHGMADVILRRTAMPAVVLELGSPDQVAMRTTKLADAVRNALEQWLMMSRD